MGKTVKGDIMTVLECSTCNIMFKTQDKHATIKCYICNKRMEKMTDIKLTNAHIMFGNALERLKELPDNSVDSIVTDPPYGLSDNKHVADTIVKWVNGERDFIPDGKGFMGKSWDAFVPPPAIWDECFRVLKPGGHLLSFFGTRTQDIGTLAIRLAGFEIRDSIAWLYGSGFPKSLDISKAIYKQAGAEREVVGKGSRTANESWLGIVKKGETGLGLGEWDITAPATEQAKQYAGWGTALKPAHEPITVARKPLSESTVANNVLKWGTGGLNIDASRIGTEEVLGRASGGWGNKAVGADNYGNYNSIGITVEGGRFPANIMLDEEAAKMLDEQSGVSKSSNHSFKASDYEEKKTATPFTRGDFKGHGYTGGASRFFYVAKASKKDRNEGLDETNNIHPTVKPTALMEYLIKLVTPVGGTVLDPFTGSGSTGKAALLNGFKFIGCEMTEEYLPIIEGRLNFAEKKFEEKQSKNDEKLF